MQTITETITEKLKSLPPSAQQVVEGLVNLLSRQHQPRQLKLNWRGGLKDLRDKYTSVELQHQILKEWNKDVSD